MSRLRVIVIDTGINVGHPHLYGATLELGPDLTVDGKGADHDPSGHGTAVAAAIFDLAPEVILHIVRVFDETGAASIARVRESLEYAATLACGFVNLSFGTSDPLTAEDMAPPLRRLKAQGTVVVSPATTLGLPAYPGSLPEVYGVLDDPELERTQVRHTERTQRRYYFASPFPRDLPHLARTRNFAGVSFAAANLTGNLLRKVDSE